MNGPSQLQVALLAFWLSLALLIAMGTIPGCGGGDTERALSAEQCVDACAPGRVSYFHNGKCLLCRPACLCEAAR
jgi:hypothetical protein